MRLEVAGPSLPFSLAVLPEVGGAWLDVDDLDAVHAAGACLAAAAGLVLSALSDSIVFFLAPSDIAAKAPPPGRNFRLGGLVEAGSVTRDRVDGRPAARFRGTVPEPRAGLASGHIPGSRNLPHSAVLTPEGRLRPEAELRAAFAGAGIDLDRPVITTCGSGITASVLALALAAIGHRDWSVYDGSWTEWGGRPDTPIATGDA